MNPLQPLSRPASPLDGPRRVESGPILVTDLENPFFSGKVRDTYSLGNVLLMVTTDRLSAYDVVLPTGIPDKGKVLTQMSAFWFEQTSDIVPNHLIAVVEDLEQLTAYCTDGYCPIYPPYVVGRTSIVKRAEPIPMECIVRGYLAGSSWQEYRERGTINGEHIEASLVESDRLPEPRFTPTTKATDGHDAALTPEEAQALVGAELHDRLRSISLQLYAFARDLASAKGIIIADTKFEFGWIDGELSLIDEALTPDSSRFWLEDVYQPGRAQESYDKQFVRDWLTASGWNKEPPAPELPAEIVEKTAERYRQAFRWLADREIV